jgi:hypothetical protein
MRGPTVRARALGAALPVAGAALVLAAAAAPAAALETQWAKTDKTMHALVQDGYEIKGLLPGGRIVTVLLQKAKSVYSCHFGAEMIQVGGCDKLSAPRPYGGG